MEAKDLMIGDFVYRPDCVDQVCEIRSNGIIGLDPNRGLIPFDELEPIEITPKILEKNGFVEMGEGVFKFTQLNKEGDDYDYYIVIDLIMPIISRIITNRRRPFKEIEGEIKCVHELQHALKLFQIDKKIEL